MKKVLVVTGTRAEFGLLKPVIEQMKASQNIEVKVCATGSHYSKALGDTYREIEDAGITIDEEVRLELESFDRVSVARSMGAGIEGFVDIYNKLDIDLIMVLGDRYELLSVVCPALLLGIPVAHIHGGDVSEGAIDDSIRHSLTKMSHLHFVASAEAQQRVSQLGEEQERIFLVGAPGIDNMMQIPTLDDSEIEKMMPGFSWRKQNILVTYHSETMASDLGVGGFKQLLLALDQFPDLGLIMTYPNADPGADELIELLEDFAEKNSDRVFLKKSLGVLLYRNCLQRVDAVVGNSSSGLIEVPVFKIPTLNIGERQKGRLRGDTVVDVLSSVGEISSGLEKSLTSEFKTRLQSSSSPYGDGHAAQAIVRVLESVDFSKLTNKKFVDLGE